jgi:hypothetical protein
MDHPLMMPSLLTSHSESESSNSLNQELTRSSQKSTQTYHLAAQNPSPLFNHLLSTFGAM